MNTITLEEAKKVSATGDYRVIPIGMEIYSDSYTPIQVLRILQNVSKHCYILESIEDSQKWGRYTFLGYHPTLEVTCLNGTVTVTDQHGNKQQFRTNHPGSYL